MRTQITLSLMSLALVALTATTARADEMSELRARFQSRDAKVQSLKTAGTIGETSAGFVEVVKDAPREVQKLLEEENADRKKLYALIATRDGVTAEVVADRAARRNFGRAAAGEFLKYPDGQWRQK